MKVISHAARLTDHSRPHAAPPSILGRGRGLSTALEMNLRLASREMPEADRGGGGAAVAVANGGRSHRLTPHCRLQVAPASIGAGRSAGSGSGSLSSVGSEGYGISWAVQEPLAPPTTRPLLAAPVAQSPPPASPKPFFGRTRGTLSTAPGRGTGRPTEPRPPLEPTAPAGCAFSSRARSNISPKDPTVSAARNSPISSTACRLC